MVKIDLVAVVLTEEKNCQCGENLKRIKEDYFA